MFQDCARFAAAAALAFSLASCGYIGDPLPPALNIADRIVDLRAVEYGDRIIVDFTIPPLTTEGLALTSPGEVDLRIGPGETPFDENRWSATARKTPASASAAGPVRVEFKVAPWIGKQVVIGVRLVNKKGRASGWSNMVPMNVVAPIAAPVNVAAEPAQQGARITWKSSEPSFRIFRKGPEEREPRLIGNSNKPEFIDATAQLGLTYEYVIQAVRESAESELPQPVPVTPRDIFPPAPPAGLNAVAGVNSIELVWERNTETDLKGYRVYRAAAGGEFEVLAEFVDVPAYSDRQVDAGKRYRYTVSAIDVAGNESPKSSISEITAP